MITTKAYITEVPSEDSNIYRVRVPLMEDNTETEAEFEAILSHSPGIYKGINVGDCVIVTYEDDKYDTAIILGKLFTEIPESENVFGKFDQLEVTGNVILPQDTKIGNYTTQDIFNLYQGVDMKEGGGNGSINPEDLKQYVQWYPTERKDESTQEVTEVYADHIQIMTGDEYDAFFTNGVFNDKNKYEMSKEDFINTLFFLTSVPNTKSGKLDSNN